MAKFNKIPTLVITVLASSFLSAGVHALTTEGYIAMIKEADFDNQRVSLIHKFSPELDAKISKHELLKVVAAFESGGAKTEALQALRGFYTDLTFEDMMDVLETVSFDSDRLGLVQAMLTPNELSNLNVEQVKIVLAKFEHDAARNMFIESVYQRHQTQPLLVSELKGLMGQFENDSSRLKLLSSVYPADHGHGLTPEAVQQLMGKFDHDASRVDFVQASLSGNDTQPLNPTEFKAIMTNFDHDSSRISLLSNLEGNYTIPLKSEVMALLDTFEFAPNRTRALDIMGIRDREIRNLVKVPEDESLEL